MQEYPMFRNEEEYRAYVLKELEESEREAADPNTRWVTWEDSLSEGDALLLGLKPIRSEEEYKEYVRRALEESEREAADPNTNWISEEEFSIWAEEWLYALENRYAAKSA